MTSPAQPAAKRTSAWLFRHAWGRRLETGITVAIVAARVVAFHSPQAGLLRAHDIAVAPVVDGVLGICAVATLASTDFRRWIATKARVEHYERALAKAFLHAGLGFGGLPIRLTQTARTPAGPQLQMAVPSGTTAEEINARAEHIAAVLSAREVRVVRDPATAAQATVTISYRDPFAGPGTAWPGLVAPRVDLFAPFPFAVGEAGECVQLSLVERNLLIGGEPGGGKSTALSVVAAATALDPTSELWLFDGKLVELAAWRPVARCFVGADVAQAADALEELHAEMRRRYEWLLATGARKVTRGSGFGLVLVAIDELSLFSAEGTKQERERFTTLLRGLVARGRAAGIVVVCAIQRPSHDVVSTSLRDLFAWRFALRCTTDASSDVVLGDWASLGYSAAKIDPSMRGCGWLLTEGGIPAKVRGYSLDDAQIAGLVARAQELRR